MCGQGSQVVADVVTTADLQIVTQQIFCGLSLFRMQILGCTLHCPPRPHLAGAITQNGLEQRGIHGRCRRKVRDIDETTITSAGAHVRLNKPDV